jgi:hypothetical protein
VSAIKRHLEAELQLLRQHRAGMARQFNGWHTTGEFVLKNGREWQSIPARLPDGVKCGRMKDCFRNAALLALGWHRNTYIYCEGYAVSVIPVPHAWCVDLKGNVIDVTWNNGSAIGSEYYGIAIKSLYLQEFLMKTKRYGLIDAWDARWPMLKDDPKDWRHPVNDL